MTRRGCSGWPAIFWTAAFQDVLQRRRCSSVALDFSRPGKAVDNAFIESFNETVRRECLSQHCFTGLEDAQQTLDAWREDYNNTRPHRSLANQSPEKYRGGGHCVPDQDRLVNSLT